MAETYEMNICGCIRKLPIIQISDTVKIASFALLGDAQLVLKAAEKLVTMIPGVDYMITTEAKGIPLVQEMARRFRERYPSLNCGQLLSGAGLAVDRAPDPERRTQEYYRKRPCPELVYDAAAIVEAICAERGRL